MKKVDEFLQNGYCLIQSGISTETIKKWKTEFDSLFEAKRKRFSSNKAFEELGGNHDRNRWNMRIPSESQIFKDEIFAIPEVIEVLDSIFKGKNYAPVFIASDIAGPDSKPQTIHQDGSDFAVAVNIPLVDVPRFMGPTQIWPGTHLDKNQEFTTSPVEYSQEEMNEMENQNFSYLELEQGDISIRDLRMVHRGTTNQSDVFRPYLSIIYFPVESEPAQAYLVQKYHDLFLKAREKAYQSTDIDLIDFVNALDRLPNMLAYTDRIGKRKLNSLSEFTKEAQHQLRFAHSKETDFNVKKYSSADKEFESECEKLLLICKNKNLI